MRRFLAFAFTAAVAIVATAAMASVTTVDRGALLGSAEGRIWSQVVDEVGNTQGAAEVWHLGPARPGAVLRLTVDAPGADQIDIRVPFVVVGAGGVEATVSDPGYRTPTGFSMPLGPFRSPEANPDLQVFLYPRHRNMDQTYRITAAWEGGDSTASEPTPQSMPVITLRAQDFVRGCNVAVSAGPVLNYGVGVLLNAPPFREVPNCAEYRFTAPAAGIYRLEIEYAALESRPVRVILNGVEVASAALAQVTGCWFADCQVWSEVGTFALRAGENTLLLDRNAVFPHIRALRLSAVDAASTPAPGAAGAPPAPTGGVASGRIRRMNAAILAQVLRESGAIAAPMAPAQTKGNFASDGAAAPRIGTGGAWLLRTGPQQRISQLVVWGGPLGNMVMGTFDGVIYMGYDVPRLDRRLADGGQGITINELDGGLFVDIELPATIADRMTVRLRIASGEQAVGTMERTLCDMQFSDTPEPAISGCAWEPASDFLIEDAWLAGLCEQGLTCYFLIPQEMVP